MKEVIGIMVFGSGGGGGTLEAVWELLGTLVVEGVGLRDVVDGSFIMGVSDGASFVDGGGSGVDEDEGCERTISFNMVEMERGLVTGIRGEGEGV